MSEGFIETRKKELNDEQVRAVKTTEGPVLVLAGAGSGKTRVLTYRIAHLIQDLGIPLESILAMTFSNKAAREMHDRVKELLGDTSARRLPWISTFHSVCVRVLRRFGPRIGLDSSFVIYDEADQLGLLKSTMKKLDVSEKDYSPKAVLARISQWKNEGKLANETEPHATSMDRVAAKVYEVYSKELLKANALDFDDLLLYTYRLFKKDSEVKQFFQEKWQYVLVDEFQDTNDIQYKLLKELLNEQKNICVVGDDDQSIYGWRGAKIENILNFNQEYKEAAIIKLEQNYRSTGNILKAAHSVIDKNDLRHEKELWTESGEGEKILMATLGDDRAEAQYVVSKIQTYLAQGISAREVAVLYRVNSLSRVFEEECLRQRVPYKIIGGFRFYERKEIKDLLAYLKLFLNPADIMSFRRSINLPVRGVGKASIEKIEAAAFSGQQTVGEFLLSEAALPFKGKAAKGVEDFRRVFRWSQKALNKAESLVDLTQGLIDQIDFIKYLRSDKSEAGRDREANVDEFLSAIQEFEESWSQETSPAAELNPETTQTPLRLKTADFLERVSLMADTDQLEGVQPDQVTFMSLHAAKGLEFKICFLAGLEEGLFPMSRAFDDYEQLEEERRLCYVGITRAKEKLFLTRATRRRRFGSLDFNLASRFLDDLPAEVLETYGDRSPEAFETDFSYGGFAKRRSASGGSFDPVADVDYDFDFDQTADGQDGYRVGMKVSHPSFGTGVVQKVDGLGTDEILTITFKGRGKKKVLSQFVQAVG